VLPKTRLPDLNYADVKPESKILNLVMVETIVKVSGFASGK
jgi:hypothetical protein